ncbi:MAG TPA: hypothetical protein O0Y08_05635 [Methanocorpusculum sp.]|nr:hypothetical protein [Methanocorpusculum sp.]HJJ45190.1 hypothetical protein [Methanocorpusculum sp.]HJJ60323.1 hypothetical protein [Methanocorpusculum sp.]
MRKSTIILIAGLLLLCAVLCTAGCVEVPSHQISDGPVVETADIVS